MLVVIVNALARPHRRIPDALKALVDDGVLWFAVRGKLSLANTSTDHRTGYAWCDHLGAICYATTTKIFSTVVRVGNLICVTRLDVSSSVTTPSLLSLTTSLSPKRPSFSYCTSLRTKMVLSQN